MRCPLTFSGHGTFRIIVEHLHLIRVEHQQVCERSKGLPGSRSVVPKTRSAMGCIPSSDVTSCLLLRKQKCPENRYQKVDLIGLRPNRVDPFTPGRSFRTENASICLTTSSAAAVIMGITTLILTLCRLPEQQWLPIVVI